MRLLKGINKINNGQKVRATGGSMRLLSRAHANVCSKLMGESNRKCVDWLDRKRWSMIKKKRFGGSHAFARISIPCEPFVNTKMLNRWFSLKKQWIRLRYVVQLIDAESIINTEMIVIFEQIMNIDDKLIARWYNRRCHGSCRRIGPVSQPANGSINNCVCAFRSLENEFFQKKRPQY